VIVSTEASRYTFEILPRTIGQIFIPIYSHFRCTTDRILCNKVYCETCDDQNVQKVIQNGSIEIYDILGRLIQRSSLGFMELGWNKKSLSISNLVSGTYFCRIASPNYSKSQMFTITR
jgi:hypothetical protein